MNATGKTIVAAAVSGLLFGTGLLISGMTDPAKVLGFLGFFGDWDARLLFVMGGAIAVNAPLTWWILRRRTPLLEPSFRIPSYTARWHEQIDAPLVLGSALFGVGWGLAGYCPGPAIVSAASFVDGHVRALVFILSMIAGMALFTAWQRARLGRLEGERTNADLATREP